MSQSHQTVSAALDARAGAPPTLAFRYLLDGNPEGPRLEWTFADLRGRACGIAAALRERCAPGDRVILLYPPGLEFIAALFACFEAGMVAVPAYPPDPRQPERSFRRLVAMAGDCAAKMVIAESTIAAAVQAVAAQVPQLAGVGVLASDPLPSAEGGPAPDIDPDTVAYLQYTSGSTGRPRGVVIRHRNIVANIQASRHMQCGPGSRAVAWVPVYHDLGLVAFVLSPVLFGFETTLFSPVDFLRRPARWMEALSHFRATHTAAPPFGLDLAVRKTPPARVAALDLSALRVVGVGAEPVRADTLDRFVGTFAAAGLRPEVIQPTYGLAECVLYATFKQDLGAVPRRISVRADALAQGRVVVGAGPGTKALVSCGRIAPEHALRIVDPATGAPSPGDRVGEIWVAGPSVADGYRSEAPGSASSFGAQLADAPGVAWLRTGDLGFVHDGEVVLVGRHKDLVIVGGRNLYPQDLERTVEEAHPAVRPGCVAVFAVDGEAGEAVGIAAEIRREAEAEPLDGVLAAIRLAVTAAHEAPVQQVALLRAETLPKTSSGKISRAPTRAQLFAGQFSPLAEWTRPTAPPGAPATRGADPLEAGLRDWLARELGVPDVDPTRPLAEYGLDSAVAVALAAEMEARTGRPVATSTAWAQPTLAALVRAVSGAPAAERIPPAPEGPRHPLSFTELGLFRILEREPGSPAYTLFFPLSLGGDVDAKALGTALQKVASRHDNLRTAFVRDAGVPTRWVLAEATVPFDEHDLSNLPPTDRDAAVRAACDRVRHRPFDLTRPPLLAAELLRLSPTESLLLLAAHHLAVDAWSVGVILRDLGLLYEAARRGETPPVRAPALRMADYATWADARFRDTLTQGPAAFTPYLADGYRLPADHPLPANPSIVGARRPFVVPEPIRARVDVFVRARGVSLAAALFAAFQATLHRHAASPRVSCTLVRANRALPGMDELVGYLVYGDTVHSRLGDTTWDTLVARARDLVAAEPRDTQPYNVVVQPPSMRVVFNLSTRPLPATVGPHPLQFRFDLDPYAYLWDVHDLMLRVFPTPAGIFGELVYRREILEPATIERIMTLFLEALDELAAVPAQEVRWT